MKFADDSVKVEKPTEAELFAYANTDTPIWANIIEKAYAKYKNDSQIFLYKKENHPFRCGFPGLWACENRVRKMVNVRATGQIRCGSAWG